MNEIVLVLAKREGVINLKKLIKETGFSRNETIKALHFWSSRGKLSFVSELKFNSNSCVSCILRNTCKFKEVKNEIRIK
jgi:hypothetical protein